VSSRCGSADVFEQLGVNVTAPPQVVEHTLREANIAFFFAPTFHPSMRHAAPIRRDMGIRTTFNLLGPLTNPAGATRQIVGVPRPELTQVMARALLLLGAKRAWVVHGAGGLDEISNTGHTKVSECRDGAVHTFFVHPSEFGLAKAAAADLRGGDAVENAAIIRSVFDGKAGAARDIVLLNAGAALFVAGRTASVREGIDRAGAAIDSGAARGTLDRMVRSSQTEVIA
jgi:anthranilate phosphoribosyltransferase